MNKNQFGKVSKLFIRAVTRNGTTMLEDLSFTAPYKVMNPFQQEDGRIQVMLLAASAGIMEGDRQEFEFQVEKGADLEFVSQSYDKIHEMQTGCAKRNTNVVVQSGSKFRFNPQPTIPFQSSAFENQMKIQLEDDKAQFFMNEILSCGRAASGEQFLYRYYYNYVEIYRAGQLIYRDNTKYEPKFWNMTGLGMYESYTHLANLFFTKRDSSIQDAVWELLEQDSEIEGGITKLASGDYTVRILGRRAQKLEQVSRQIMERWNSFV